jgi:shikimate dehydrogenase
MLRFAVLGQPVAHSRSPQIHQWFGEQLGIALSYEKIEVAPEAFDETQKRLHAEGHAGLNITLPHKLAAFAASASRTERAELAGAVNTLIREPDGWRGDNTDGPGLVRDLKDNLKLTLAGKKILVLGAGGAARGILKPLLDEQPAEVALSSRNPWKPEELAAVFKPHGAYRPCTHLALKGDRFDLVINATSVGHDGRFLNLPGQLLAPGGACYDLTYGKAFEPFRDWAEKQNAALIADGLGMLVEQAAVSFEAWHGVRPQTGQILDRLREKG